MLLFLFVINCFRLAKRDLSFRYKWSISVELSAGGDMGIDHQKMELLLLAYFMNGGDEHSAGFYAHHGARREVRDGDAGLPDELLRLVERADAGKDGARRPAPVVESEAKQLLGLGDGLAFEDLDGAEIGFGERLKIDGVLE